jgi:hypothetical protein
VVQGSGAGPVPQLEGVYAQDAQPPENGPLAFPDMQENVSSHHPQLESALHSLQVKLEEQAFVVPPPVPHELGTKFHAAQLPVLGPPEEPVMQRPSEAHQPHPLRGVQSPHDALDAQGSLVPVPPLEQVLGSHDHPEQNPVVGPLEVPGSH